jgi:hypothetical protein
MPRDPKSLRGWHAVTLVLGGVLLGAILIEPAVAHVTKRLGHLIKHLNPIYVNTDEAAGGDLSGPYGNLQIVPNTVASGDIGDGQVRAADLGTLERVSAVKSVPAGASDFVIATCPPGSVVVSGGGDASVGFETYRTLPSGNGWYFAAQNENSVGGVIVAFAMCLQA